MTREVGPVERYGGIVFTKVSAERPDCLDGMDFLMQELQTGVDPDPDERCGLLNDSFEVYSMNIPKCKNRKLAIAIDRTSREMPVIVLGTVSNGINSCFAAKTLAQDHLGLVNPIWEPQT